MLADFAAFLMLPDVRSAWFAVSSALLGVLVGAFLHEYFQRSGRLSVLPADWCFQFETVDRAGSVVYGQDPKGAAVFQCTLRIFNSSRTPRGLRDFRVEFRAGRKKVAGTWLAITMDGALAEQRRGTEAFSLPAQAFSILHLKGGLEGEPLKHLAGIGRFTAHLVAHKPSGWRRLRCKLGAVEWPTLDGPVAVLPIG